MAQFHIADMTFRVPRDVLAPRLRERLSAGSYEGFEATAARRAVSPEARVLDLGSGIGLIAAVCARAVGAAQVTTVEADPRMVPVVRANLDANGFDAATVLHGAVGAATGETAAFRTAPAFWASSLSLDTGRGETVQVPSLDLFALFEAHRPTVVLMDVEGAEANLFDRPWPPQIEAVVMELHRAVYGDAGIARIFAGIAASGLVYAPDLSRGAVVGFRRPGA